MRAWILQLAIIDAALGKTFLRHGEPYGGARHHPVPKRHERGRHVDVVILRPQQHDEQIEVGDAGAVAEQVSAKKRRGLDPDRPHANPMLWFDGNSP